MKSILEYLQLIKEFYWKQAPFYQELTFAPMTLVEVLEFEKELGFSLEQELKDFLTHCDFRIDFEGNYSYESPKTTLDGWSMNAELIEEGIFKDTVAFKEQHGFTNWEDGYLAREYCSKSWVPFGIDGGGNQLLVDHNPGRAGKRGQLVYMEFQDGQGPGYYFDNLTALLALTYQQLLHHQWEFWEYGAEGNLLIEIDEDIPPSNHQTDY